MLKYKRSKRKGDTNTILAKRPMMAKSQWVRANPLIFTKPRIIKKLPAVQYPSILVEFNPSSKLEYLKKKQKKRRKIFLALLEEILFDPNYPQKLNSFRAKRFSDLKREYVTEYWAPFRNRFHNENPLNAIETISINGGYDFLERIDECFGLPVDAEYVNSAHLEKLALISVFDVLVKPQTGLDKNDEKNREWENEYSPDSEMFYFETLPKGNRHSFPQQLQIIDIDIAPPKMLFYRTRYYCIAIKKSIQTSH